MIVAFDANIHGYGHAPFNRAFVEALLAGFGERIVLYVNPIQARLYREGEALSDLEVRVISVTGGTRLRNAWNAVRECFTVLKILRAGQTEGARLVFGLSVGPFALPLIKILAGKSRSAMRVAAVAHGELQDLLGPSGGPASRVWWLRLALRMKNDSFVHIVLSDEFKDRLSTLGYDTVATLPIPHPYIANPVEVDRTPGAPLRVVAPGGSSTLKGSHRFFEVAAAVHALAGDNVASFCFHGSWDPALERWDNGLVEHADSKEQLEPDKYLEGLRRADLLVFLYPPGTYDLMASGALFDAIAVGRPVFALRTPYFDWVFRFLGPLGQLFDSVEELAKSLVAFATEPDAVLYRQWLESIERVRRVIAPEAVGERLASEFGTRQR